LYITVKFVALFQSALRELTSRDSFCAAEIDIFRAIQQWAERNTDQQLTVSAMSTVRLPLVQLDDLLNVVRQSSLVSADAILDAIKLKTECKDMELNYRGFLSSYHLEFPTLVGHTTVLLMAIADVNSSGLSN